MVKTDAVKRAADAVESTSSTPDEEVDSCVAETDDSGTQRHDTELLDDTDVLELGVTDERAEHGVPVENDHVVLVDVRLDQHGHELDEDKNGRHEVHDDEDSDDGITMHENWAEVTRVNEDDITIQRKHCHVYNVFEYYQNLRSVTSEPSTVQTSSSSS